MTSYHVVSYLPEDGTVESKGTYQGYDDESSWARGQAWGVYGYTMCYRFTKQHVYLKAAYKIAEFIMSHCPSEKILFLIGIIMLQTYPTNLETLRLLPSQLPHCWS